MGLTHRVVVLWCLAILVGVSAPAQTHEGFDKEVEARVFAELNQARAEAGAPPLRLDHKLTDAARRHSLLLAENQKLSHQFPGEPTLSARLHAAGTYFTESAENAGVNSDADNINAMFLASPGHRVNMMNPAYNAVGIGVVQSGRSYWVTEDFADEMPSLSSDEAAHQAAAAFESKWNRLHPEAVKRVNVAALHTMACETASGGRLQGKPVTLGMQQARRILAFSTANPSALADNVDTVLDMPHLQNYAVAACTPQESGDNGHFWILMAFF